MLVSASCMSSGSCGTDLFGGSSKRSVYVFFRPSSSGFVFPSSSFTGLSVLLTFLTVSWCSNMGPTCFLCRLLPLVLLPVSPDSCACLPWCFFFTLLFTLEYSFCALAFLAQVWLLLTASFSCCLSSAVFWILLSFIPCGCFHGTWHHLTG